MYVCDDAVIYIDEVINLCKSPVLNQSPPETTSSGDGKMVRKSWKGVFILIHLRLGVEQLNRIYIPCLKATLRCTQSVGIIGGKPRSSYYFVAYQDDNLFYLDPHTIQPAVSMSEPRFNTESYHYSGVTKKISFDSIDPSLALGFYCPSENDFHELCSTFNKFHEQNPDSSAFWVAQTRPNYAAEKSGIVSVDEAESNSIFHHKIENITINKSNDPDSIDESFMDEVVII